MSGATSITVRVPMAIRKRGGRKVIVSPDGSVLPGAARQATTTADPALLKALARAFRWKRMLEDGVCASVSDIARAEKLDRTYVGDVLRLTLLASDMVEAIVEGRQPVGLDVNVLREGVPADWGEQRQIDRNAVNDSSEGRGPHFHDRAWIPSPGDMGQRRRSR